jgi:hypothetical protein
MEATGRPIGAASDWTYRDFLTERRRSRTYPTVGYHGLPVLKTGRLWLWERHSLPVLKGSMLARDWAEQAKPPWGS